MFIEGNKMTLIRVIPKTDGTFLKTYQSKKGNITHVWKTPYSTKVANCDTKENPRSLVEIMKNKITVYIKSQDGSTIIKEGDSIKKFPYLVFNTIVEMFFK